MRLALPFVFLACPAAAWEYTPVPICTLSQTTEAAEVTVTYDPALPEYAITITLLDGTWPDGPVFTLAFEGGTPLTIQTDRHALSDGDKSVTVRDRGFGNVLNGMEFSGIAVALLGDAVLPIPLTGIKGPMQSFRNCPEDALS
ncbi:MAG: excinuclease ABC subunit B [Flavimaricola sp.]|nr:excinuclease ABC subunit B [Flavimaricola sp.]